MIITVTDPCKPLPLAFDPSRPLEVEVGCGKGRFLTGRAAANPGMDFLGIERMLGRVHSFDDKCRRLKISNAHVLRLEALYTFWYLLPAHSVRTVYVFFPDPWPKKKQKGKILKRIAFDEKRKSRKGDDGGSNVCLRNACAVRKER